MGMNSKAFTPKEVEEGLHLDLLKYLLDYNSKSEECYNDIHIWTDGFCTVVEWCETYYSDKYGPQEKFEYVDEESIVVKEKIFPDNHFELCYTEKDYQERLAEFLKENPNYKQNDFGLWYDTREQEAFEKECLNEKKGQK